MPKIVELIYGFNSAESEPNVKLKLLINSEESQGNRLSVNTKLNSGNWSYQGLYSGLDIDSGSITEENYRRKPELVTEPNEVRWVRDIKNSNWLLVHTTYPILHWEPLTFRPLFARLEDWPAVTPVPTWTEWWMSWFVQPKEQPASSIIWMSCPENGVDWLRKRP